MSVNVSLSENKKIQDTLKVIAIIEMQQNCLSQNYQETSKINFRKTQTMKTEQPRD